MSYPRIRHGIDPLLQFGDHQINKVVETAWEISWLDWKAVDTMREKPFGHMISNCSGELINVR